MTVIESLQESAEVPAIAVDQLELRAQVMASCSPMFTDWQRRLRVRSAAFQPLNGAVEIVEQPLALSCRPSDLVTAEVGSWQATEMTKQQDRDTGGVGGVEWLARLF